MKNRSRLLTMIPVFLISFSAVGVAESSKPTPPPANPVAIINAIAGEAHVHSSYGITQNQDEATQATTQTEQTQNQVTQETKVKQSPE